MSRSNVKKERKLVVFLFIFISLIFILLVIPLKKKQNANKENVVSEEELILKDVLRTQEDKDKEDLSVEKAMIIIDRYKETPNIAAFEEIISEFILSDENHVATKTQLLNFFIPEYNKKVKEFNQDFANNYEEILSLEVDGKFVLTEANEKNLSQKTKELLNNIEKYHLTVLEQPNVGRIVLVLDWNYFIEKYSKKIEPIFVEVLELYNEQSRVEIRDSNNIAKQDIVIERIIKNEELLKKMENDLYTENIYQNITPYYNIFFGENEKISFDIKGKLNNDYLRLFHGVLSDYPDSQLASIIVEYLNLLKTDDGYYKNSFATVYLRESVGGEVNHYEYDENGNLIN